MSVYQRKFGYLNRFNTDFGLQVVAFDPDDGEMDSYLSVESVFTDKFDGTRRYDYGAKYKETSMLYITMVKNNHADFSRTELREVLGWLTGLRKVSWLDLYNDDDGKISYSFLGRVTDVKLQKMDARVIGIKVEFTSVSPLAFSSVQKIELTLNGNKILVPVCNYSDEYSLYLHPNITFVNKSENGSLNIFNRTTGEETIINSLAMNEKVVLDTNKIIYSDNQMKIFSDDFNFVWPRLVHGYNHLHVTGIGHLIIEYRNTFKFADAFDDNDDMNTAPPYKNILHLKDITLLADNWIPDGDNYYQNITLYCATKYTKIDLQPTESQILSLQNEGIKLQVINDDGNIRVYSYGGKPSNNFELQATLEETDRTINRRYENITVYSDSWEGQDNIYTQPVYIQYLKKNEIITVIPTTLQNDLLSDSETTIFVKNDNGHAVAYAIGYIPNIDYDFEVAVTETTTDVYKAYALPEEDIFVEPLYY